MATKMLTLVAASGLPTQRFRLATGSQPARNFGLTFKSFTNYVWRRRRSALLFGDG